MIFFFFLDWNCIHICSHPCNWKSHMAKNCGLGALNRADAEAGTRYCRLQELLSIPVVPIKSISPPGLGPSGPGVVAKSW